MHWVTCDLMIPVVILGEKDHGKSTLIGRLIYETKSMPKDRLAETAKTAKRLGKRFEWAHLLDSFRYERKNEMTLDTTRAIVKLGKTLYEFIDVPGHKELIKNMLTGASDARFAVTVIDISEGITPQTLRHMEIAEFLGIEKIMVAVNKIDKVHFSKKAYYKAIQIFSRILSKYRRDKMIFIPVSTFTGNNLIKKNSKLKWFKGPTLSKTIEKNFQSNSRPKNKTRALRKPAKNFESSCIFIEKPGRRIVLESGVNSYPISTLTGFDKMNNIQKIKIKLKSPAYLENKFVIKASGKIVGVCNFTPPDKRP